MRRHAAAVLAGLVIGAWCGALVGAGPAMAGGWAATVIDPLPSRVEAGKAYEVTFWVLQHGTHPYNWSEPAKIGEVGLTLTDARGTRVFVAGRALAEPAHYTTTLTVPHDGRWRVTGVQGIFQAFHVGTLAVPGTLESLGVPAAPSPEDLQRYWPGMVRPPVLPVDLARDPYAPEQSDANQAANVAPVTTTAPAARTDAQRAVAPDRAVNAPVLVAMVGGVLLALALAVAGRRRWTRRVQGSPARTSGVASA